VQQSGATFRLAVAPRWSKFASDAGYLTMQQENFAMRNTVLALAIVALATPAAVTLPAPAALAQGAPNLAADSVKLKTDEDVKAEEARERGFREGLGQIPNAQQGKRDPWGNTRGSTAAPAAPNPAPKPPKAAASNQPNSQSKPNNR
jgi:hypothetical protein